MILIFGVRAYTAVLATLTLACRHGHVAAHRVLKVTRKFTLFFVPLFPVQTRYYSVCAQCGLWVPWNKEEARAAASSSAARRGDLHPAAAPDGHSAPTVPVDPVAPPLRPVTALDLAPPVAAPGWYPDPAGESEFRYWDGAAWTEAVHGPPAT